MFEQHLGLGMELPYESNQGTLTVKGEKHSRRDVIQGKEASKDDLGVKTTVTLVKKLENNVSNHFCCLPIHPIINVVNVSFLL